MEQKIENAIDSVLASIAPQLYMVSIILGVVLILFGILFAVRNTSKRNSKSIVFVCIGILAIISAVLQM